MTIYICRSFISLSLKCALYLCKPHVSSLSHRFFSSSREKQPRKTIAVADYLLHKHQFSPETVSKVSTMLGFVNPEKSDLVLSFLKMNGFSKTHLEQVIKKVPIVLSANLDRSIEPKIKIFRDLGFSPADIAEIISSDPWILTRSVDNRLVPSILVLRNVLGSISGVSRALKSSGWFLHYDLEKTMMPNIEFMKSCGISSSQIMRYIYSFPRFFLHKPENLKEFVRRVDETGFDRNSRMFLHAIRTLSSMNFGNWELKLVLFRTLGFSEDDILSMFKRVPQVFAVSERKIKEVTEFLFSMGNFDISYIVRHPGLLICSIEHRLKPRLQVLGILESKNLLKKKPSIATLSKISDKKFIEKYVNPYPNEIGKLYLANEGS